MITRSDFVSSGEHLFSPKQTGDICAQELWQFREDGGSHLVSLGVVTLNCNFASVLKQGLECSVVRHAKSCEI